MKKLLFLATSLAMAMTSCLEEEIAPANVADGEGNFTLTLEAPEAMGETRTYSGSPATFGPNSTSALGGLTNVDWNQYDLRYKVSVYQKNADDTYVKVLDRTMTVDNYSSVTMSFRLATNRTYRIAAWADFVLQGTDSDLHYDTSDLTNVSCLDDVDHMLNDESRDAYCRWGNRTITGEDMTTSMTLMRPFAKVRVATTDWALDNLKMPEEFTVKYKNCKRFSNYNVLTGATLGETTLAEDGYAYTGRIDKNQKEYALNYDQTDHNRTLIVDYLFCTGSLNPIHMEFTPTGFATRNITTDIPTRQNFLTTILGNMLTSNLNLTISCDEMFKEEYNNYYMTAAKAFSPIPPSYDSSTKTYTIKTPNELVWLEQKFNTDNDDAACTVRLANDIDLEGYYWTPMVYAGADEGMLFDGGGFKICNINIDANNTDYAGLFGNVSNGRFENLTLENVTINNAAKFVGAFTGMIHANGFIKNCTAKHVWIRGYDYDKERDYGNQNLGYDYGGLVGIFYTIDNNETYGFKDCTSFDIDIFSSGRLGGIVAFLNNDGAGANASFLLENCKAENCRLHVSYHKSYRGHANWLREIGSLVGALQIDDAVKFKNCSRNDLTYMFGWVDLANTTQVNPDKWLILHDGDEGVSFTFNNEVCGPMHKLYGRIDNPSSVTIE